MASTFPKERWLPKSVLCLRDYSTAKFSRDLIAGVTGMGSAVKFIPRPIIIGFTNGIAILIASTQVKDFFGLQIDKIPSVFWQRIEAFATHFRTWNYEAT